MINKLFSKIEHFIYRSKINVLATIYINLRCLSFVQAIRLPIFVYGKIKIQSLSGNIQIENCNIYSGMIKIGKRFCRTQGRTTICLDGLIICHDDIRIDGGSDIHVEPDAILKIGKGSRIYEDCMIYCYENIEIGDFSSITYHANIFDTDFHYTIDVNSHIVTKHTKPIKLGKYNWIGNKATIKKGTITSDYTIVAASYSLLCKDYTIESVKFPIIGGNPAKIISHGKRRIFNWENQSIIDKYFASYHEYSFKYDCNIDELCKIE